MENNTNPIDTQVDENTHRLGELAAIMAKVPETRQEPTYQRLLGYAEGIADSCVRCSQ